MKKIFYLFVILSLTACVASKWHDENDTRSVLKKIVDSKYDPKYDNLIVENLNTYWTIKAHYNSDIYVFRKDLRILIEGLPSNRITQGYNITPNGTFFDLSFRESMYMTSKFSPFILFNNSKVYLIQNSKRIKLKPENRYYRTGKEGTFAVWKEQKGYEHAGSYSFHIPCNEIITPDTIVHIGGIYEDGKELPPIEFKIFKKTDGQ